MISARYSRHSQMLLRHRVDRGIFGKAKGLAATSCAATGRIFFGIREAGVSSHVKLGKMACSKSFVCRMEFNLRASIVRDRMRCIGDLKNLAQSRVLLDAGLE